MTQKEKYRNFTAIMWDDSVTSNWRDIIAGWHIPCIVSPHHDHDVNPAGEPKKPHRHIMLTFAQPRTIGSAEELFKEINAQTYIHEIVVKDLRSMARYFCHLDEDHKYIYNVDDVECFAGADYLSMINLSSDKYKTIREMQQFCHDNGIYYISTLFDYAYDNNKQDWYRALCDYARETMLSYMKSIKCINDLCISENIINQ